MNKVKKQAAPTGRCWCGCGKNTGKFFTRGCDRKAQNAIIKLLSGGKYDTDITANFLFELGYSPEKSVVDAADEIST